MGKSLKKSTVFISIWENGFFRKFSFCFQLVCLPYVPSCEQKRWFELANANKRFVTGEADMGHFLFP